jgi:hypothetical protein
LAEVGAEAVGAFAVPPPPQALIVTDKVNHKPFSWRNLPIFVTFGPLALCFGKLKRVSTFHSCAVYHGSTHRRIGKWG